MNKVFASIIVPVFQDPNSLKKCLSALADQRYPADSYEVIVVNNDPGTDLAWVRELFPSVRFADEVRPGSYAARNKGLSLAKGQVVAFTDADCLPARDWIERGVSYFPNGDEQLSLGGRIDTFCQDRALPTAAELHELVFAFPQKFYVEKMHFTPTANMWTTRVALESVGHFPEILSGGDRFWGEQAQAAGVQQVFAGNVVVRHPARRTLKDLASMYVRIVGGDHDVKRLKGRSRVWVVVDLAFDLGIVLRQHVRACATDRLSSWRERMAVMGVAWFVWGVRLKERLRLVFGGRSRRA